MAPGSGELAQAASQSTIAASRSRDLADAAGNPFICYHAYPYVNGEKQSGRNAYIEPYTIDYDAKSETAPQGVLCFGLLGNGVTAPVGSEITWHRQVR